MLGSAYRRMYGVLKRRTNLRYNPQRSNTYGFIVLLPEVDPELAEKLVTINDELPPFSKITAEKIGTLMGKHIVDYECAVRNADRNVEEHPDLYSDLFKDVINPLEKTISAFDTVLGIFKCLYLCDKNAVPPNTYFSLVNRIVTARNTLYHTPNLYETCKKCDKSKLTEEQARFIDKILIEGRLNGIEADTELKKAKIEHAMADNLDQAAYFRMRADVAKGQFFFCIDDALLVQEVPRYLLRKMSNEGGGSIDGPWTVKLYYGIGEKYMEYCSDRDIRFMIWHAEDKASSLSEGTRELINSICLETIRINRHDLAVSAGFKNYFEANVSTKMAGSLENVNNVLNSYLKLAKPAQLEEVLKLQELAHAHHVTAPIQLWDVPYWARKYKRSVFNFDDELLRPYLPLERVLSGLFALCSQLFGIRIEEVKDVDKWHSDVRFFYVYEPEIDKPVAGFYFDPYLKAEKLQATSELAVVSTIRNSSAFPRRVMPLAALIMYLEPPGKKVPCLLSFSETKELFCKFGYCLQQILNKSSYTDLAGLNFVEFDAIGTVEKFMENWIYDPKTFASISQHYESGAPAPNIDLEGVRKHMAGYRLCKEIFKARMDIEMHVDTDKFWLDIGEEQWDDHFIFPMSKYFSDPCRYVDIFADKWGAAYYSHIWAEMLAADIYTAFTEEKDNASVGARFRDTFLTFGGSCHASEVFRRFRGRDPNPEILPRHLGLIVDEVKTIVDGDKNPNEDPKLMVTC